MEFRKETFKTQSSDGKHTLSGKVYIPEGKTRGFFHVVHGMAEHIERYDAFMGRMASEGWICFGYNHLGHKDTALDDSELGFIADKDGDVLLVDDVKNYYEAVKKEYSDESDSSLPYVLMGHSMGSFVVRLAAERTVSPDKLIIMGTGGKNPLASAGLMLIAIIKLFCGGKHVSKLVDNMAFGAYNKRFEGDTDKDPSLWLTNDADIRNAYYEDKYCGFKFTVSAMGNLIKMIKDCNRAAWYKNIPRDMSVLLVSGADDPVGNYSAGVREVESLLRAEGSDVECIIYEGARHEILNDISCERVTEDIISFSNK